MYLSFRTVTILVIAYCIAALIFGLSSGNDHFPNRMGATLSAIGALLVIVQIYREIALYAQDADDDKIVATNEMSPANLRIANQIREHRASKRHQERLQNLYIVAIIMFAGDLLHGWGDTIIHFAN